MKNINGFHFCFGIFQKKTRKICFFLELKVCQRFDVQDEEFGFTLA